MPAGLSENAAAEWWRIVGFLQANGLVGEIDSTGLHLLVMTRERLMEAHRMLAADPEDKNLRINVCALTTSWLGLASRYGLTSYDRLRLRPGSEEDTEHDDRDLLGD